MNDLTFLLLHTPHKLPKEYNLNHAGRCNLMNSNQRRIQESRKRILSGFIPGKWANAYDVAKVIGQTNQNVRKRLEGLTKDGVLEDRWRPLRGKVTHEWRVRCDAQSAGGK